jgi:hypothetical protein
MNYTSLEHAIQEPALQLSITGECREMLFEIIDGRMPIAAVRHPLGFFCLPVLRDGDHGICLHLWTSRLPGAEPATSIVHCHSWDLVSFVLYGRVTHTLFSVDDDASGPEWVFEVHSRGDVDEIVPTSRRVRSRRRNPQVTEPGNSYRLAGGQFHTSVAERGAEAATLVLGRTRDTADLSISGPDTHRHEIRRRRCSSGETSQIARIALEHLGPG